MKKSLRVLVHTIETLIVLGVIYFEPTYGVRGIAHRETFFNNRPTSYWRSVVERDLHMDPRAFLRSPEYVPPTFWQQCTSWVKSNARVDSSHQLFDNVDATPVLGELAQDSSPQIAAFARDALDLDHNLPSIRGLHSNFNGLSRESKVGLFWMNRIHVHNMKYSRATAN